ncbi:MAG TPA: flagellar hook-associated protein FlgL [Pseudacidobacterium sp.]|nr:flagellar hook-associated protein FlgL [Pseudacidobacterium sp.]
MRFDPLYLNNAITSLDQASALQQQLTNELSSGKRVNSLADDPVAAGENVLLASQLQMNDSFSQTETSVVGRLQVADSTLGSVVSQLTQAVSLAMQGNNGTLNASDLQSIASQLSGIRDEVVSLANTTYMGTYLFSGSKGNTAPFSLNTSVTPNTVTYNGDSVVSYVMTPNGQQIQTNVPGNAIFNNPSNDVLGVLNNLVAQFSSGAPSAASVADATALNSALNYVSQQRVVLDNSITRLQAAQNYTQMQGTQITAAQTDLLQTDVAKVSTQMSTAETQQTALIQVVNLLEKNNGNLFSLL